MMIKVRSTAVMETAMTWEGFVPESIPADERWAWIKDNVDGAEFTPDEDGGDWQWGTDVQVIKQKTFEVSVWTEVGYAVTVQADNEDEAEEMALEACDCASSNKNVKFSREVHGDRGTCGTTEVKS